jgi:aquaporin Z
MEAAGLGLFMISAGAFATLLEYPLSPIHQAIDNPLSRRALMGLAMGLTAIALIYSPWGKQSGAHFNPAVTLTFMRLGKVNPVDALFYVVAQFAGGLLGVLLMTTLLGSRFSAPPVAYVATRPGIYGVAWAFLGETVITFVLMFVVLRIGNTPRVARYTGLFAGLLVALYITFEAPISGMSMNPARTFASAAPGGIWNTLWVYFVAPPLGMLMAAQFYLRVNGTKSVSCAKLHHQNNKRCIFCAWQHRSAESTPPKRVLRAVAGVIA